MNDPHVEKLHYRFMSENVNDIFDKASSLYETIANFTVDLKDSNLIVIPQDHYPDEESAKSAFEPFLHSWESSAFLSQGRFRIYFRFSHADIIDRNPTPGEVNNQVKTSGVVYMAGSLSVKRYLADYPLPVLNFKASQLTDEIIGLIKKYYDGRIPLTAMTNWVLTILEREYGNRKNIKNTLNVNLEVINTLGRLSESSDPEHGRKAKGEGPSKLNQDEINWLEEVVVLLVNRIGELNAGVTGTNQIRMSDLPKILLMES